MINAEQKNTRLDTTHMHLSSLLMELQSAFQNASQEDVTIRPALDEFEEMQKKLHGVGEAPAVRAELYATLNIQIKDMLEHKLNDVVFIGNKDLNSRIKHHLANDFFDITPEFLLEGMDIEPEKPVDVPVIVPPVKPIAPPASTTPRLSRRKFLAGAAALGAAGVGFSEREAITRVATNRELRELPAILASRETIEDTVMAVPSDYQRELIWQKYFGDRPDIIPLDVWNRKYADGNDHFVSMCPWLEVLANVYRNKEKESNDANNLPTKDFTEYFDEFLGKIQDASAQYGIDFAIVLSLLTISGRNMTSIIGQNQDVDISRKQAIIGAVGSAFSGFPLVNAEDIDGMVSDRTDAFLPSLMRQFSPQLPLGRWNSIRLSGVPTVGINDIEPEIIAEAIFSDQRYITTEQRDAFLNDPRYAECAEALRDVWHARQAIEQFKRNSIRPMAENYLNGFGSTSLEAFFNPETSAQEFQKIGVHPDNIDKQYDHFSRAWKHVCWLENSIADDKELAEAVTQGVINDYKWIYDHDLEDTDLPHRAGYSALLRDQIDNSKFFAHLKSKAGKSGNESELGVLRLLESNLRELDGLADNMRAVNATATALLGKLEYDVNFQIHTGVASIKMLSKKAEAISINLNDPLAPVTDMSISAIDPTDRNAILTNVFDTIAIREISPITLLTNELLQYPRMSKCDAPYDRDAVSTELRRFKQRCIEIGVVPEDKINDVNFWLTLYGELALERNIRANSRIPRGESSSENSDLSELRADDHTPVLNQEQKNILMDYFMEAVMPPFSPAFETALRFTFPHKTAARTQNADPAINQNSSHKTRGWKEFVIETFRAAGMQPTQSLIAKG